MDWSVLGSIFFLELAVGIFGFLALVHPAPVAPFFYRLNGAFGVIALAAAWWMHFAKALPEGFTGILFATSSAMAAFSYLAACAPIRSAARRTILWVAFASSVLALFAAISSRDNLDFGSHLLFTASIAFSGLIVGGVLISMLVGHSYLTVPGMEISHLSKLNWATAIAMLFKIFCFAALLWLFAEPLQNEEHNLFRPMGLFFAGVRVFVGVLMPFVFVLMVVGCLKHKATRSATGILYASTIFVIVGEALGYSLWNSYGVPL